MTSRERIRAAWEGKPADHLPLTTWCFGLRAPRELGWERDGRRVEHWYSLRMEHIHTLPAAWTLEDDFARAQAWLRWGVDDLLDVSVPWSVGEGVGWVDSREAGEGEGIVLRRSYETPAGPLCHAVRRTGETVPEGWVVQPEHVPLFEDFNIPRAIRHAVAAPGDVRALRHLYAAPDPAARESFHRRMELVARFADREGVAVQAWSAFGMDAAVWLCGTEGAVLMAMDDPAAFADLLDAIAETDIARTALAASHPAVDLIVERGWYSSTDFWSPDLFDRFLAGHIRAVAEAAHAGGKRLGYVMTTGVQLMASRLAEAGVDVLYFVDPVQDRVDLKRVRDECGGAMALVGGTNALSLAADPRRLEREVAEAIELLAPTKRFVLHPVDALFPDTPLEGVERLVGAWERYR